jgi:hypothetical protein
VAATKAELSGRIRGDSWWEGLPVRALARRYGCTGGWCGRRWRMLSQAAVSVFPNETCKAPRSRAGRPCPSLIYVNEAARSHHFAAWQEPALVATEVRAAFRSLR